MNRNSSKTYWVKGEEVRTKSFLQTSWIDFVIAKAGNLLGYYAKGPGLDLREFPRANSKKLAVLKGDLFEITPQDSTRSN